MLINRFSEVFKFGFCDRVDSFFWMRPRKNQLKVVYSFVNRLIVPAYFAFSIVLLQASIANGQVSMRNNSSVVNIQYAGSNVVNTVRKELLPGLREDPQRHYKLAVPFLSLPANSSSFDGDSYWMGSVTTQSYNRGKIGRYYYWDMLGNLQGSYLFFDVAGKGKRGLKLVFPRQRTSF